MIDYRSLGFESMKAYSEEYVELDIPDWEEINSIISYLKLGDTHSAQVIIDKARKIRRMGSGAAGGMLLKLVALNLIPDQFEGDLNIPSDEDIRRLDSLIQTKIGKFQKEFDDGKNKFDWKVILSIFNLLQTGNSSEAQKRLDEIYTQWSKGFGTAGSILAKLQSLGVSDQLGKLEFQELKQDQVEEICKNIEEHIQNS